LKFKISYLYLLLGVGIVVILFILSNNSEKTQVSAGNIENQEMPNDEVHKGMQNPADGNPSKSNVSKEVYQKMDILKKEVEANPNDTIKIREYADFMAAAHRQDEAIKNYEKILSIDPKRNDVLFNLSIIYFTRQDYDNAEKYTNQILKNDKNNAQAMYNLGAIAASKGQKERAMEIWNKLISEHPGDESAELAKSSLEKL
jgi:tetratricopeptide (TPR) repeat protein